MTASCTLTITDPGYRGRLLAEHTDLTAVDAVELAVIYQALGFPETCITVTTPAQLEEAA